MRVTASKLALLQNCQYWARPEAEWTYTTSAAADRGTRFHKAIALYSATESDIPLVVEDDIREEYARAREWFDALGVGRGSPNACVEVAFAWDPATDEAEILGSDRDYSKANGRLCGTADLVLVTRMDGKAVHVTVWDYKTGNGNDAGPQLRGLGLMAARAFGVDSATVAALEVRAGGVTEVCREELDSFALSAVAGETADYVAAIPTAEPIPGSHCGERYCSARLSCPLGNAATAELMPADALAVPHSFRLSDPIETAEHAIWAIDVVRLVGAKLDAIKEDIKAKCPKDGWIAADGRMLKEGSCEKSAFDKHKALALVKQLGATPEQVAALNYTFPTSTGLRVSGGGAKPRTKRSKAAA